MRNRIVITILVAALTAALASVAAAPAQKKKGKKQNFPATIALPAGWMPEGIATGNGNQLYVGSIPTGQVIRLNARTGQSQIVVPQREGRRAIGLKFDDGLLFVAGGPTGRAFVYNAQTGADVANLVLTTATGTFVNDVTLTEDFAFFTDSRQQQLYRVDRETFAVTTVPITGDLVYDANPDNNEANGIAATPDGGTLYVIQSNTGQLFTVDPATGASKHVPVTGGDGNLASGDGLLLHGRTLYVVQNRLNKIAVVDLRRSRITGYITDSDFDVPTTVARKGNALYLPNARFGTTDPQPAKYDVVRVKRKKK